MLIRSRENMRQIKDLTGLQMAHGIRPTDIDLFLEIDNRIFVIGEMKHVRAKHQYGQTLALQRLCDALAANPGKSAVVFWAQHNEPPNKDIDVASCLVTESYNHGVITEHTNPITVREFIETFKRLHTEEFF